MSIKQHAIIGLIIGLSSLSNYGFFFFKSPEHKRRVTIMINPAGDAQHTGRKVDDGFERSVTLQLAQEIKNRIEQSFDHVTVILTRSPGQTIAPLQNASFANRMQVDFFLSIHCYQEHETKPTLYLYQFSYGDTFITKQFDLAFTQYDQAHLMHAATSALYGTLMQEALAQSAAIIIKGPFKIPCKPLIGVQAPALALELGIINKESWLDYVQPLCDGLTVLIEKMSS